MMTLIRYRIWKLFKTVRRTGGLTTIVLIASIAWVGFLLVRSSSFIDRGASINLTSEINPDIIEKNAMVNSLAQQIIHQQIKHVFDVGIKLIDQTAFASFAAQNKWQNILDAMTPLLKESLLTVDQIIISDGTGTARIATLPAVGKNLSSYDWYQGARRSKMPYLSETYIRETSPQRNVVTFSFPVLDGENVIAVIGVQMKTNLFLEWLSTTKPAEDGYTFIVDQRGRVVAHPDLDPQGELKNYADHYDVKKAVDNLTGTEAFSLGEEIFISSFRPLSPYGWGVVTRIKSTVP